jgi:hypothetical protein
MYSYKRGIENLLRGKNERHLLPSSENFVLPPVSSLNIVQNLFKPNTTKLAQFLRSVYTQLRQQCNFALLNIIYLLQTSFSIKYYWIQHVTTTFIKQRIAPIINAGARNDIR